MATNYIQAGDTIEYTNSGSAISSGDVVIVGSLVCVALTDIANGATGTLATKGVFDLAKTSGAVIDQGTEVIWDSSASSFDDSAFSASTGDISDACIAWENATTGETTIKVALNVGVGTIN